jgi:predicted RNA binding protein YcfA (HicA-like mRNA interferase family)
MEKLLFRLGFEKIRQKGNHALYKYPDGTTITIPHHKGGVLSHLIIRKIFDEIENTIDESGIISQDDTCLP